MKTLFHFLALAVVIGLSACSRGNKIPPRTLTNSEWESVAGMIPPTGAQLVAEASVEDVKMYGILSSKPIMMPLYSAPGVKDYLTLPIDNTKAFIENTLGVKIEGALLAISSKWQSGAYSYHGSIVRTNNMDYMVIQRDSK